jgi:hypothetical protein
MITASINRVIQRLVEAADLVDPVDGVQHRGVVPVAELAADFLERRAGQLPCDVHGDLATARTWARRRS